MITEYEANEIMKQRFNVGTPLTVPSTLYAMLSTTAINADGTGATEPVLSGYTRVAIPSNGTYWSVPTTGEISNLIKIDFPQATDDWGDIIYFALVDAETSGNIRYYQDLTNMKTVQTDDIVSFPIGYLKVKMSQA